MKLYRYESSRDTGSWTESVSRAYNEYEEEKDYLRADELDEDDYVSLVTIDIPDELIDDLEDECHELKRATIMPDPDWEDEDPRADGYGFDYYAAWSDDLARRG